MGLHFLYLKEPRRNRELWVFYLPINSLKKAGNMKRKIRKETAYAVTPHIVKKISKWIKYADCPLTDEDE